MMHLGDLNTHMLCLIYRALREFLRVPPLKFNRRFQLLGIGGNIMRRVR